MLVAGQDWGLVRERKADLLVPSPSPQALIDRQMANGELGWVSTGGLASCHDCSGSALDTHTGAQVQPKEDPVPPYGQIPTLEAMQQLGGGKVPIPRPARHPEAWPHAGLRSALRSPGFKGGLPCSSGCRTTSPT